MAFTFVQAATSGIVVGSSKSSGTATFASPPGADSLIVAVFHNRGDALTSVSLGTAFTEAVVYDTNGIPGMDTGTITVFYRSTGTQGTAVVATFTPTSNDYCLQVMEYTGSGSLGDVVTSVTNHSTSAALPAVTPVPNQPALMIAVRQQQPSLEGTFPAGWTNRASSYQSGGDRFRYETWDQIVALAGGSYDGSITGIADGSTDYALVTLAFTSANEPGIWMDWAGNGFGDDTSATGDDPRLARGLPQDALASVSDNVTPWVMRADWNRGGSYDHVGAAGPGGFTLILDNSDGRYDPDNTASPLYGFMQPGIPVWGGAIATTGALSGAGSVAGFLAGYVREFALTVDSSGQRICEVIGEDAFGRYQSSLVSVEPSLSRSQVEFRGAILDALGESTGRRDLDDESGQLPFSAVDTLNGLDVLEELNTATATRHFMRPADSKEAWYDYVTVNKVHGLGDAADGTLDGDDIHSVDGWRITNDNVIEVQRADFSAITLTPDNAEVWRLADVPLSVSAVTPTVIWAQFTDYVFNASVDYNAAGSLTTAITNFGKTAKIELWYSSLSGSTSLSELRVLGQQVVRGDTQQVVAGDTSPGARAGSTISSDYIGQAGAAQGLVDFIVWKYGQPLKRPALTVEGKNAATFSTIFGRDLFDVLDVSITKLSLTTRRLEIVGLRGSVIPGGPHYSVTYELQETPNQSPVDWFAVDTDAVNGSTLIAPF